MAVLSWTLYKWLLSKMLVVHPSVFLPTFNTAKIYSIGTLLTKNTQVEILQHVATQSVTEWKEKWGSEWNKGWKCLKFLYHQWYDNNLHVGSVNAHITTSCHLERPQHMQWDTVYNLLGCNIQEGLWSRATANLYWEEPGDGVRASATLQHSEEIWFTTRVCSAQLRTDVCTHLYRQVTSTQSTVAVFLLKPPRSVPGVFKRDQIIHISGTCAGLCHGGLNWSVRWCDVSVNILNSLPFAWSGFHILHQGTVSVPWCNFSIKVLKVLHVV